MDPKLIPMTMDYPASFPEVVSSSIVSSYQACPMKFWYQSVLNLKTRQANIHLNAGGALAAALNDFRRSYYGHHSPVRGDVDLSLAVGLRTLINAYRVDNQSPSAWEEIEASPKGLSNMAVALVAIVETYNPADPYGLHPYVDDTGEVWAERSFSFETQVLHPETGMPLLFAGRTDWIGVHNGHQYVMDEKTTSQMGAKWADQWALRGQFIGYSLGFAPSFPQLAGVWVRGVCLLKDTIKLAEHPVIVPQWQMREWWTDLNYALADMVRDWKNGHFRHDRGSACASYSGCSYLTLCTKPPEHRKSFSAHFEQSVYDPLSGEDKKLETL